MANFFEVKDIPAQKVVRLRRITGPRDSAGEVVYIDESKLTGATVTAVKKMPFSDRVTWPTGVENGAVFEVSYTPPAPVQHPAVAGKSAPTGKKVGDTVTVASLFTFTDSAPGDYTITANPAASVDLTTTPGSVIFKATGAVTITATNKTTASIKASVAITVAAATSVAAKSPAPTPANGDTVTVASLFTFTGEDASHYTITANPAASVDLTTTPGSVIFKAAGAVTITATNKTASNVNAHIDITVS